MVYKNDKYIDMKYIRNITTNDKFIRLSVRLSNRMTKNFWPKNRLFVGITQYCQQISDR